MRLNVPQYMKHRQTVRATVSREMGKEENMHKYKVVEKFVSINGEGKRAGQLAVFIRFKGCNLCCSYCDTKWANEANAEYTAMTAEEIYEYIKSTGVKNCTLTGGEPLLQENISELLELLARDSELRVEIETNGSIDLKPFTDMDNPPSFTMDYKQPDSEMEKYMCLDNFELLKEKDTVKFVSGSKEDLYKAKEIIDKYHLAKRCSVYLSPVFGKIEPSEMVEFLMENNMNDVNIQLQLHKFIWEPDKKGV